MANPDINSLTPEQAANVIDFYFKGDNQRYRDNGWKDGVPLGQAALHTTLRKHSISDDGFPLLSREEMAAGLEHIEHPPEPPMSAEYERKFDKLVDYNGFTPEAARRRLEK